VVGLNHYLVVSLAVFVLGLHCVLTRRNAIGILMGVELILGSLALPLHSDQGPWRDGRNLLVQELDDIDLEILEAEGLFAVEGAEHPGHDLVVHCRAPDILLTPPGSEAATVVTLRPCSSEV